MIRISGLVDDLSLFLLITATNSSFVGFLGQLRIFEASSIVMTPFTLDKVESFDMFGFLATSKNINNLSAIFHVTR